jgi:hypothetical protein
VRSLPRTCMEVCSGSSSKPSSGRQETVYDPSTGAIDYPDAVYAKCIALALVQYYVKCVGRGGEKDGEEARLVP